MALREAGPRSSEGQDTRAHQRLLPAKRHAVHHHGSKTAGSGGFHTLMPGLVFADETPFPVWASCFWKAHNCQRTGDSYRFRAVP